MRDTERDLAALQGTWEQVALEADGVASPVDPLKSTGALTTFTGDRFEVRSLGGELLLAGAFELDASTTPPSVTWIDSMGPDLGKRLPASYTLVGDRFTFIAGNAGAPRPIAFATRAGETMRAFTRRHTAEKSPLPPPPARLVDDGRQHLGRFAGPPAQVNLLDAAYHHLPRPLRKLRLKEWQAVQLVTPELFVNVALFDAKLMSLMQAKIYDRTRGEKIVHEWKLRPGAFTVADQVLDSTTHYGDRRGSLAFRNRFAAGRLEIDLDLHATRTLPRIAGHLELHTDRGASHVASLPFAGDVGMYSHKGMFPAVGELVVGDRTFAFGAADARALLDDHKGYYPYVMRWDWVTSANVRDGRARGFNLTRNQCRDPDTFNENCAWIDDQLGLLPAVTFARTHERTADEEWHIRDRDGRVDLTFRPSVPGDVSVNAVIVHSKYRGPFGHFAGRLEPAGLAPIVVDGWFGMGEDFHLRC